MLSPRYGQMSGSMQLPPGRMPASMHMSSGVLGQMPSSMQLPPRSSPQQMMPTQYRVTSASLAGYPQMQQPQQPAAPGYPQIRQPQQVSVAGYPQIPQMQQPQQVSYAAVTTQPTGQTVVQPGLDAASIVRQEVAPSDSPRKSIARVSITEAPVEMVEPAPQKARRRISILAMPKQRNQTTGPWSARTTRRASQCHGVLLQDATDAYFGSTLRQMNKPLDNKETDKTRKVLISAPPASPMPNVKFGGVNNEARHSVVGRVERRSTLQVPLEDLKDQHFFYSHHEANRAVRGFDRPESSRIQYGQ
eukprot:TRINITY_DN38267_c0_g1_i1.p1 TRINITY_DN38267_c0_g1~~TRINITY_DN38267_c0_g1_i1.p1  ORF type:complete len:318 (-),score=35.37 TRINITY_DN38267_c0_g1_i1:104-1015(-)